MYYYKTTLSKKDKEIISSLLIELTDEYDDFFVTKNNIRIPLRENYSLLEKLTKHGERIVYGEGGILITTGISDGASRIYVKILAKNEEEATKMLQVLLWNYNKTDLYAKIKVKNPIVKALKKKGFKFAGGRGKRVLLKKEKEEIKNVKQNNEQNKNASR